MSTINTRSKQKSSSAIPTPKKDKQLTNIKPVPSEKSNDNQSTKKLSNTSVINGSSKPGITTHYNDDWWTPRTGTDKDGHFSTDWLGMKIQY